MGAFSVAYSVAGGISDNPGCSVSSQYIAEYRFTELGVTSSYLIDYSGNNRHFQLVGGLNPYFKNGFAIDSSFQKYPKDTVNGGYVGLASASILKEYPAFAIEAEQFFRSPESDAVFIEKDRFFRFYNEDGLVRLFAIGDLLGLQTPYLQLVIEDNIYKSLKILKYE